MGAKGKGVENCEGENLPLKRKGRPCRPVFGKGETTAARRKEREESASPPREKFVGENLRAKREASNGGGERAPRDFYKPETKKSPAKASPEEGKDKGGL